MNDILSKRDLMNKFLKKISDGEINSIQSMEIKKHKKIKFIDCLVQGFLPHSVDLVDSTKLHLNYYGLNTKGLYWELSEVSRIEKMLIDVFGLKALGIDDVVLNNVNRHDFSY